MNTNKKKRESNEFQYNIGYDIWFINIDENQLSVSYSFLKHTCELSKGNMYIFFVNIYIENGTRLYK